MSIKDELVRSFDERYENRPPWDIGKPQPVFVKLARSGVIGHRVLDVGCGTGENALYFAGRGHAVVGIDFSPKAITKARQKAEERQLGIEFLVHDALDLGPLGRTFDTVTDSGLFHTFSDKARIKFARSLHRVLRPGGNYLMLCFSDKEPGDWGPRRVTEEEIRATFLTGWTIDRIEPATFATNSGPDGVYAWLARVERIEEDDPVQRR